MPNRLGLDTNCRTLVWRKIVSMWRSDPILARTIRPLSWHTFDGSPGDNEPFGETELPACRILPFGTPAVPLSPTTQDNAFGISVAVLTEGLDVGDLLDLWGAFEAVIFTGDGSLSTLNALQLVYSRVISCQLGTPAITPSPEGLKHNAMLAEGTLAVNMVVKK